MEVITPYGSEYFSVRERHEMEFVDELMNFEFMGDDDGYECWDESSGTILPP